MLDNRLLAQHVLTHPVPHKPSSDLVVLSALALAAPGLPPVNVRLTGAGPVDAVAVKRTASRGDAIGVDLDYRGAFLAETLALALNGRARIEPLLPEDIRPAVAGGLAIDLSTRLESQTTPQKGRGHV